MQLRHSLRVDPGSVCFATPHHTHLCTENSQPIRFPITLFPSVRNQHLLQPQDYPLHRRINNLGDHTLCERACESCQLPLQGYTELRLVYWPKSLISSCRDSIRPIATTIFGYSSRLEFEPRHFQLCGYSCAGPRAKTQCACEGTRPRKSAKIKRKN